MMFSVLVLAASAFFAGEWPGLVQRLSHAGPRGDAAELRAIAEAMSHTDFSALDAREQATLHYSIGYAKRALSFTGGLSSQERLKLLQEAARQLERAVEIEPSNAEAHALLGSTYGVLIGVDHDRAPELAPKSRSAMRRAADLGPNNPRVQLLLGTSALYRPVEYGGGADKAEVHLRKAIALFAQEPPAKPWPNWGRYEAHMFLGQALAKLQRRDEARREYEAALAIVPDSEYVRSVLIPRLKR